MAEPPASAKRAALVYNPVKVADAAWLRQQVQLESEKAGWREPLLLETTIDDPGQGVTRDALEQGVDVVLVAGGDGTVRCVSEAMNTTGVPLAIVPSGTGNVLARNIKLPLTRPDLMVRSAIDGGDIVPIDVGVAKLKRENGDIEEHAFVVMAGIGLDAAMIANTSAKLKKRVGWVAYVDGAARSLPSAKPFHTVWQRTGGKLHSANVQSLLFANCGTLTLGIDILPNASIADGSIDLAVVQPSGPLGWVNVARRISILNSPLRKTKVGRRMAGKRVTNKRKNTSILYESGDGFEAAVSEPHSVELDGDEFGEAVRIYCRVSPGGLLVVVPKGHLIR
ncbi:MAG: diacylglycerol kinase family protein [Microbacterium sp.]